MILTRKRIPQLIVTMKPLRLINSTQSFIVTVTLSDAIASVLNSGFLFAGFFRHNLCSFYNSNSL